MKKLVKDYLTFMRVIDSEVLLLIAKVSLIVGFILSIVLASGGEIRIDAKYGSTVVQFILLMGAMSGYLYMVLLGFVLAAMTFLFVLQYTVIRAFNGKR